MLPLMLKLRTSGLASSSCTAVSVLSSPGFEVEVPGAREHAAGWGSLITLMSTPPLVTVNTR